jgi:N-acetylglutamate synthase-like GNAT family acetyltransferase
VRHELRTELRSGDLGQILRLHGQLYAAEYGFDIAFEAYVAETLAEFAHRYDERTDRIWLAESAGEVVGSVAIVGREPGIAQLRWFLVHPSFRGAGLGRRLLHNAIEFCRETDQRQVFLLTVSELTAAAHLYQEAGFRRVDQKPVSVWGAHLIEERYELQLG